MLEKKLERDLMGVIQRRLIAKTYSNLAEVRPLIAFVRKPVGLYPRLVLAFGVALSRSLPHLWVGSGIL